MFISRDEQAWDWSRKSSVRATWAHILIWLLMPFVQNDFSKYQNPLFLPITLPTPCTSQPRGAFFMCPPGRWATRGMGTPRSDYFTHRHKFTFVKSVESLVF